MRRDRRVLVILAKWPRAGQAKRRLASDIGPSRSTALAQAFLGDTIALARRSGADSLVIAYAPRLDRERFAKLAPDAQLIPQPRGPFGTRLQHALTSALALGDRAVLIGSDSPTLSPRTLRTAFRRLEAADCVIGPAADGGYYLIGCRQQLPRSFFQRMLWSTAAVLPTTLARAKDIGLEIALLRPGYDVDDAAGLQRLLADGAGLRRAQGTRDELRRLGWAA